MPGSILASDTTDVAPTLEAPSRRPLRRRGLVASVLHSPRGVLGVLLVMAMIAIALFPRTIAPGNPFDTYAGPALSPPSSHNILGTDNLGRDMFIDIVHGVRTSMTVVFWVVAISTVIGIAIGLLAGYRGGLLDDAIMRITELFMVVPRFFLALLVIAFWGPGLDKLIILLGITSWPFLARIVRIETIRLKGLDFVNATRAIGASRTRIIGRHLMPNLLPPVLVVVALFASRVVLIEAGLAFLGLGDPTKISLGYLANNAQQFLRLAWWMAVFPGLVIVMIVLGFNLLSDAVNDSLRARR